MAAITPRLAADISLVDRLSDAYAFARNYGAYHAPPRVTQTDFLPAYLSNSANVSGESGAANAHSTSNSSMAVDNSMGTLRVSGDGTATVYAVLQDAYGSAGGKLVVLNFTITDVSYVYSLTGQLSAGGFGASATAKLTSGSSTIFAAAAGGPNPSSVTLSENGTLLPGAYTLSVQIDNQIPGSYPPNNSSSSANFSFALDPAPPPTPTPTPGTPTPTPTPTPPPATPTPAPTGTATPAPTPTPGEVTRSLNLSTRLRVGTGDNIGIGGFIVTGSGPRQVLLRGIGPSLSSVGIVNALGDPMLELHGPSGFATVANNNWRETQEAEIIATGLSPSHLLESAILATLDPGAYTALLSGNNNGTGVGLVEIYDVTQGNSSKLANMSSRGFIGTGGDIVIAGFILGGGTSDDRIVIRGIGPSLEGSGLSPVLANPTLELRDSNGALLVSNNDWQDSAVEPPVLGTGLEPTNDLESAIGATLPPGSYTALLSGVNGGTGLGLVEVYDLGRQ